MQPLIEEYSFGRMKMGGRVYTRDLIVTPEGVVDNWWREEGHVLKVKDLEPVLGVNVDCVVIGTGYSGAMRVLDEVVQHFSSKGVEVHVADTRRAVRIYNELVRAGRKVLGAFHLTC